MQPIFASQPMEIVHLDHLTLEPCKGKIESVLVVTDQFTRYAQAYRVKNQTAKPLPRFYGNSSLGIMVSPKRS